MPELAPVIRITFFIVQEVLYQCDQVQSTKSVGVQEWAYSNSFKSKIRFHESENTAYISIIFSYIY